MSDVEITFTRENASGIVAVGSYLIDAARRCGIRLDGPCDPASGEHFCEMAVTGGGDLLSAQTSAEVTYFAEHDCGVGTRLACQAKIERTGEIEIMTKKDPEPEEHKEEREYKKEFAELPLEKKIQELVQLEAIALSETLSFVINSPYKIADKIMDVMAAFGLKMESSQKASARPAEHSENGNGAEDVAETKEKEAEPDAAE